MIDSDTNPFAGAFSAIVHEHRLSRETRLDLFRAAALAGITAERRRESLFCASYAEIQADTAEAERWAQAMLAESAKEGGGQP